MERISNTERQLRAKIKYEGSIFKTNNYGEIEVIHYDSGVKVNVRFLESGFERLARLSDILKGEVKDKSVSTVFNFGICDIAGCVNGVQTAEYLYWIGMLDRCYEKSGRSGASYLDCTVSQKFRRLSDFSRWCENQIGFKDVDDKGRKYQLDKDILSKGNKIYSPETCCFVPQEINKLLLKRDKSRGDCPIGVYYNKVAKKYQSRVNKYDEEAYLGIFDTPEEAFYVYKREKEKYIKEVANKWKDKVDIRVYEALINYKVEITD